MPCPKYFYYGPFFQCFTEKNGADTHLLLRFIISIGLFSVKVTAYPSTFTDIDYFPIITEIPNCLNSDAEAIEQILLEYIILLRSYVTKRLKQACQYITYRAMSDTPCRLMICPSLNQHRYQLLLADFFTCLPLLQLPLLSNSGLH